MIIAATSSETQYPKSSGEVTKGASPTFNSILRSRTQTLPIDQKNHNCDSLIFVKQYPIKITTYYEATTDNTTLGSKVFFLPLD